MSEILQENNAILQRVVRMTVPHRTDKSGRVHPQQPVTLVYLNEQEADQIAYYQDYHRYVHIGFLRPTDLYSHLLIVRRTRTQADDISEAQRLQLEIVKHVTAHRVELDVLYNRVQSGKMARTFINRLNRRWKPLERLVSKYNIQVAKPVFQGRLSPLSLRALKDDGIGDYDGEIWDVDRLMCSSDWAVHKFVREGIEAQHRIKRAEEEQGKLLLQIHRVCRWAVRQSEVLLQILEERHVYPACVGYTRKHLELLLFSRFRTVQSMLDRANSFRLDISDHEQLLGVEGRIQTLLGAVQMDGEVEGPREPAGIDEDEDEDEREGEDEDENEREGEEEDRDDIAEEELGEVVMRALVEELRNEVTEEVEVEL